MIMAESVALGMYLNHGVRKDAARRTTVPVKKPTRKDYAVKMLFLVDAIIECETKRFEI